MLQERSNRFSISSLRWRSKINSTLAINRQLELKIVEPDSFSDLLPNYRVWDQTPILDRSGKPILLEESELWIVLCTPFDIQSDERHEHNRLRLVVRKNKRWIDCGYLLPDGFSPGSREWAGTAYLHEGTLSLFFTVAGSRGEESVSFLQRIYQAKADLTYFDKEVCFSNWRSLEEVLEPDPNWYGKSNEPARIASAIKAFRDPFWIEDESSNLEYLLLAATKANSKSKYDGCIAIAQFDGRERKWKMGQPILDAEGVTYEVERPHCIKHDGLFYIFWSVHGWTTSQESTFPTGLFGMVGEKLTGPFRLLNGNGLVAYNPSKSPFYAYSWFVSQDLMVSSFIDLPNGVLDHTQEFAKPKGEFVGALAPEFKIKLVEDQAIPISQNLPLHKNQFVISK